VPIVPVTIRGTFALLPKTTLAPRPGRVDVYIGEPIDVTQFADRDVGALIDRTRRAIDSHLDPEHRSYP
jgi:1-acyl-sn-glycerol-3-phosphate acyltransferase